MRHAPQGNTRQAQEVQFAHLAKLAMEPLALVQPGARNARRAAPERLPPAEFALFVPRVSFPTARATLPASTAHWALLLMATMQHRTLVAPRALPDSLDSPPPLCRLDLFALPGVPLAAKGASKSLIRTGTRGEQSLGENGPRALQLFCVGNLAWDQWLTRPGQDTFTA